MVDEAQSSLTPDEVGAIVAQWAERRRVDLQELAKLLGVDEAQAASLLRQGRGRLHMNVWLQEKRAPHRGAKVIWGIAAACLVIGALAGGFAASYFNQQPESKQSQPSVQVTTTEAASTNPPQSPQVASQYVAKVGTPGQGDIIRENPEASKIGSKVGELLADATVSTEKSPKPGLTPTAVKVGGSHTPVSTVLSGPETAPMSPDITRTLHDMTGKLKYPLPADVVVDLQTPTDYYTYKGEDKKNVEFAGKIHAKDLTLPMWQLVNVAIRTNMGQQARGPGPRGNMGRIRVQLGQAAASIYLSWDMTRPDDFKEYGKVDSKVYSGLADQLLQDIKVLGPKLFTEPNRAVTSGS